VKCRVYRSYAVSAAFSIDFQFVLLILLPLSSLPELIENAYICVNFLSNSANAQQKKIESARSPSAPDRRMATNFRRAGDSHVPFKQKKKKKKTSIVLTM